MTHVTCRLTAKNRDQLRNPTLGNNRVCATFTLFNTSVRFTDRCKLAADSPCADQRRHGEVRHQLLRIAGQLHRAVSELRRTTAGVWPHQGRHQLLRSRCHHLSDESFSPRDAREVLRVSGESMEWMSHFCADRRHDAGHWRRCCRFPLSSLQRAVQLINASAYRPLSAYNIENHQHP